MATAEERAIDLCNAGILAADAQSFFRWAGKLENKNAQGEYYLTDVRCWQRPKAYAVRWWRRTKTR